MDGNAIRIWDAMSGRELLSYKAPGWAVDQVTFAGDDDLCSEPGRSCATLSLRRLPASRSARVAHLITRDA